jgi:WD40 repeat protein
VLVSETTAALVRDELPEGVSLVDLGRHLLKDLHRPEHIFQLEIAGLPATFPELKSVEVLQPEGTRQPRKLGDSPFRGLFAFQESDAAFFFGREDFVSSLEGAIRTKPMVAVIVGSSGSGKSSALFAGLLPRLRAEQHWQISQMRPGSQPFYALAEALMPLLEPGLSETDHLSETRKLAERLQAGEIDLYQVVKRLLVKSPASRQLLVVIDQFEELYTLVSADADQRAFIDLLLRAVAVSGEERISPMVLLLTMRADFMGKALSHRPFADLLQESSLLMGPMSPAELHLAVEKPAELQGAVFEPGLVERILDDVGEQPGKLPLLQFALTLLWEQQDDGWLTHDDYEAIGGVDGALARYADEVYAGLAADEQVQARRIFVQLVKPGEGTADTRRVARRLELGVQAWHLVQHLADKRLVVTDREAASGDEIVEVVHEALIQRWEKLQAWMEEDRAFRTWQERLRAAIHQWEVSGQDEGALLRGGPLVAAEDWLAERGLELGEAERDFIQTSAAYREREQKRRQLRRRVTILALAGGLVIAIILVAFTLYLRQNSLRQAAILLAGQAESQSTDGFYDRAVLLALEALENYPYTPQAEHALGAAVSNNRAIGQYTEHTSGVTSLDWSPDGTKIASSSTDNTVRVWDPVTGETLQVIDLPEGITGNVFDWGLAVRWMPDGQHLVILTGDRIKLGSQDYDLLLWNAATGEQVRAIEIPNQAEPEEGEGNVTSFTSYPTGAGLDFAPESGRLAMIGGDNTAIVWDAALETQELILSGHKNDVNGIDWSPDETRLATASEDGTARIWDAETGEELLVLTGHEGGVNAALWSPDGAQLATGGDDGTVRIWEAENGEMIHTIETNVGIVWSLAWSPDGKALVIVNDDRRIRLWDLVADESNVVLNGHTDIITHIAWSPDGGEFVSAANDGVARVWEATPEALVLLPYPNSWTLDWSWDSHSLSLPFGDPSVREVPRGVAIWDATSGQSAELNTEFDYINFGTSFSPDNSLLIVAGLSSWPEGFVNADPAFVVNASTGETLMEINASDGKFIRSEDWSPDGIHFATASIEGAIDIWDLQIGDLIRSMTHGEKGFVNQVEWSPDGTRLLTAGVDSVARIWDAERGVELLALIGHEPPTEVWSADWSPDGKTILTTSGSADLGAPDTTVRIWDAETGKTLLVIDGHTSPVTSGDWSPDGSRIVTISTDDTMRVWDVTSGAELLNLSTPTNYASEVKWSPDGKYIAVGPDVAPPRVFRVWQSTEELIAYAKACCIFRQLTPEERQQFGLAGDSAP